jgi:hypothetical protein
VQWGQQQGTTVPLIVLWDGAQSVSIGQLDTINHTWTPFASKDMVVTRNLTVGGTLNVTGATTILTAAPSSNSTAAASTAFVKSNQACQTASGLGFVGDGSTDNLATWNNWILSLAGSPGCIAFGAGNFKFTNTINISSSSVSIYGAGGASPLMPVTLFTFSGATNGLVHNSSLTTTLDVRDLAINSTTTTGAIIGINDLSANYTLIDHVYVNNFNNCANFTNPGGMRIRSLFCVNGQSPGTASVGTGIELQGQSSFVNHIQDTLVQGYNKEYYFHSTNTLPTVGIEDVQILNSACGLGEVCITIDATDTGYGPFNYSFTNMSVNVTTQFLNCTSCNDVTVTGGNWLFANGVGSCTGTLNMFDIGSAHAAHKFTLRDAWIGVQGTGTSTANSMLTAEASADDVQITGNHIDTNLLTMSASYFQIASGATGVVERDTAWRTNFAPANPPSNAITNAGSSATNKLQTYTLGPPTYNAGCGGSATFSAGSNGQRGTVIEGGANTSCTINLPTPNRSITPICTAVATQNAFPNTLTTVTAALMTITHASNASTWTYDCGPY